MSKYNAIKTATDANIKANGRKEITGPVLNAVLNAIIDSLGKYYQFVGLATPSLNPGTPDQNVAYVAVSQGTYEHFGGLTVGDGELTLLIYDGEWRKATVRVIPDKTSQLSNDTGFVTNAVNDLINYYTRSETYTKAEVDQMIAAIKQFRFELVNTLPTASADTMYIIYLVPSTDPATGDVKDEYITIENGGVYSWEKIGRTTIDLSNYPTRSEMTTAINNALAAYITGVSATVDNNTGIPSVDVSFSNGTIHLAFHNLKGAQGNTGSSVDYPFTLVNNVITDDATQALTAAMGKYLQDEISQLEAKVDGFDVPIAVLEDKTVSGAGIAKNNGQISSAGRADYSVKIYKLVFGKTYHIVIPKLTNAYTSAYGFITDAQTVSPLNQNVTLPDPNVIGPISNYEKDVTAPSNSLVNLVVCYETAYGDPTVTTLEHTDGLSQKVDDLESSMENITEDLYGSDAEETLTAQSTMDDYRLADTGIISGVASEGYSVAVFSAVAGKNYNVTIPKLTNSHTAGFGFANAETGDPGRTYTLPSVPEKGPITNGVYDVEIPSGFSYLFVCYERTGGVPTVKTTVHTPGIKDEIEEIEEQIEGLVSDSVEIVLPNKLYAVVGDTLQLFFQGIVGVVNIADYDIYAVCSKGKTFPRYFSYTPTAEDVGTVTLTVYVKDRSNKILGQASCDLVTVSAPSSPVSAKSIFTFGDSLTSQGQWPGEAKRRLVGNSTYDSITGNGLSNLAFHGYMTKEINGQSVNYFGVGGWTWANYLAKGTGGAFRFYVSGVSSLSIGATYTNNGHTYTIQEINVTGDSGNIRCTTSSNANTPTASGTLTKATGDGDATITFSTYETENANPLWDDANNKMSFVPYVQDCGASTIDAVYVLLSWNGQSAWKTYSVDDVTGHIADAKTFARTLHTEYPSAKLFIMGLQMPSETGGLGYNYGASGGYIDGYGLKQCALNYNKALQDLCNLDEFSPYCEFVAVAPQFDTLYNMPSRAESVNIRNSVTEMLGRNGVHPSDAGYFQIADAVYRSIVANFCQ